MRILAQVVIPGLALATFAAVAQGDRYPEATLDQATYETICDLAIERYLGLDEKGLQAEYEWALDMAKLCLPGPDSIRDRRSWWNYSIEFQRHAGRTARYRGFGEQAIEDYELAIGYAYSVADFIPPEDRRPDLWEVTILRDIADAYLLMGAYELAAEISNDLLERARQRGDRPLGGADELDRLAEIAQLEGRFDDAVRLQKRAVQASQYPVAQYLQRHDELAHIDPGQDWDAVVRDSDVRRVMDRPNHPDSKTSHLREVYSRLARALRLNDQLDEAAYALETAALTPWAKGDTPYRGRLDLEVDRERAFLALARGKYGDALQRARACLDDFVMSQTERVELLDLLSRALEKLGDVRGAFHKLNEAIAIVETKRANLIEDENKQFFVAAYAPLYRRALELVVRIHGDGTTDSEVGRYGAVEESFEWSERVRARAMLDTLNRYDLRMARAAAMGDVEAILSVRDLAGEVITVTQLQQAPWFGDDLALLEYALGPKRAYLWLITRKVVRRYTLPAGSEVIAEIARRLAEALKPGRPLDDSWVAPASRLYELLVKPAERDLGGVSRLVIVGDGVLRSLPFETLVADPQGRPGRKHLPQKLLIERFAISYAPSASLLDTVSRREVPTSWKYDFWGIACSEFTRPGIPKRSLPQPADPVAAILRAGRQTASLRDLPNAPYEVRAIADEFAAGRRRTFIDDPRVKSKLLEANRSGVLRQVRFLHFATHAVGDSNRPYLSSLILGPTPKAPGGTTTVPSDERLKSPRITGNARQPSARTRTWVASRPDLLTLHEVASLKLRTELVVLSACHSVGTGMTSGDWITGLTRSFLLTGSRGVVCTLWELSDDSALMLMPDLYRQLLNVEQPRAQLDVPSKLRSVKTTCLSSPADCHPAIWSGVVYYGLPGLGR